MKCLKRIPTDKEQRTPYATSEDFRKAFGEYAEDLYLFAFMLTGDAETAHRCFVEGLQDSAETSSVFQEWARSWAKRTIVQNAIRAVHPRRAEVDAFTSDAFTSDAFPKRKMPAN